MNQEMQKRIQELVTEEINITPHNPGWPKMFEKEKTFLEQTIPQTLIKRIEHFGSTAIPNLSAKPIIDILVEVTSLEETKKSIVPILESKGYEYFWRPTIGDNPPYYAWFIKRNPEGKRSHHIHMVESDSPLWNGLFFRDYLREFPAEARRYDTLKKTLAKRYEFDRITYTKEKTTYIKNTTEKAIKYYQQQ